MKRLDDFLNSAWSILAVCALALAIGACEGDDGADGANGTAGAPGTDGQSCWDLDGNGVGDPAEDINGDGNVDVLDCAAGADPIAANIDKAQVESCATCHDGVGGGHQDIYEAYNDASNLAMTFNSIASVADGGGTFTVTLDFSITQNGLPFVDAAGLPSMDQKRFYAVQYDSATGEYLNGNTRLNESNIVPGAAAGDYVLTQTGVPFAPETPTAPFDGSHVYGYIAQGSLFSHESPTSELPAGSHVHLYDNVASASLAFGTGDVADASAYVSDANVSGCEACHGTPYYKHGYRAAAVAGLPDFAACKTCHYDDRSGGHSDWQYMVDDPLAWATGQPETADYSYTANIMNDTHMSHAMEFPYPQSMANCATCHEGKLTQVLDNSNFTEETCKSCHPIQGVGAWPDEMYEQSHRAPAFAYLWQRGADLTFHETLVDPDCTACHGNPGVGAAAFADYHTGYDARISDPAGQRYDTLYTVSIDNVTLNGNLLTVEFSSSDPAIVPELLVSFYGWDSKDFVVPSHWRDADRNRFEYAPESSGGSANPLFTEDAASVPGSWIVTADFSAFVAVTTPDIPTMIADGDIKKLEVTLTPELDLAGTEVALTAVTQTFDLMSGMMIDDYFKGANALVDHNKCNACHDQLGVTFHSTSGRGGEMTMCRNCHAPTNPGSHLELQSRSIEGYVHAIHTFQDFDLDDTFETFDPVFAQRYDLHIKHTFPNFTIRNCEACHVPGKYNVPDQTKSMPGAISRSYDVATWYDTDDPSMENPAGRNIGNIPELVVGPATKACGGCHRADMIAADAAGELASFNAHSEAFGTLVENDSDDVTLFGIIDKIMTLFE